MDYDDNLPERLIDFLLETRDRINSLCQAAARKREPSTVVVRFTADGISVDGQELRNSAGRLAKFALLWRLENEHKTFPGGWGCAFVGTVTKARIGNLRSQMNIALAKLSPGSGLRIECVRIRSSRGRSSGGGGSQFSDFQFTWHDKVTLMGPPVNAQAHCSRAWELFRSRQFPEALLAATEAIEQCPLLFPPFTIVREALAYIDAGSELFGHNQGWQQTVFHGAAKLSCWLDSLRGSIDMHAIPPQYRDEIQKDCLDDIDARLAKLAKLTELLHSGPAGGNVQRNPLNIILRHMREAIRTRRMPDTIDKLVPRGVWKLYESIESEARARLEEHPSLDANSRLTMELRAALLELAQDPSFSFPEPDGRSEQWREETILRWADTVLRHDR